MGVVWSRKTFPPRGQGPEEKGSGRLGDGRGAVVVYHGPEGDGWNDPPRLEPGPSVARLLFSSRTDRFGWEGVGRSSSSGGGVCGRGEVAGGVGRRVTQARVQGFEEQRKTREGVWKDEERWTAGLVPAA